MSARGVPDRTGPVSPPDAGVLERLLAPGAPPEPAAGTFLSARVATWAEGAGTLEDGGSVRRAASCLVAPRPGDRVVVWRLDAPSHEAWVTAVLERADADAALPLELGERASLDAGVLALRARQLTQGAGAIVVSAREHHLSADVQSVHAQARVAEIGTDVRRARHATDEVTGTRLQRAGTWLAHTLREARMSAKAVLFD